MTAPPSIATRLLAALGYDGGVELRDLPGGLNNRAFRVETERAPYMMKVYFRHPSDPHDRLAAEFAFCEVAWRSGARTAPEPHVADHVLGAALYEFIDGRRLTADDIGRCEVEQALAFYRSLNEPAVRVRAVALSPAKESCFSLAAHLDCVTRRLRRLQENTAGDAPLVKEAGRFAREELSAAWDRATKRLLLTSNRGGIDSERALAPDERRLSPSDFGFHNALRSLSGELRFVDFEYAGWDDPAKVACDFLCQPAIPVPRSCYDLVMDEIAALQTDAGAHRSRFVALLPVYRVKWCCIMLNEFHAVGAARRGFAGDDDLERRQTAQLSKARAYLEQSMRDDDGFG